MNETPENAIAESESPSLDEESPPGRLSPLRRFFESLRPSGWAQVAVVIVGATILTIGLINAVRAKDVTALVIAGAVVLVFGLVFPAEFGFSWGDARAFARRADQRLGEAEEADSPDELRDEVAQLRGELRSLSTASTVASSTTISSPRPQITPAGIDEIAKPKAWHTFRARSSVALTLRTWRSSREERFTCTVKTPTGDEWAASGDFPLVLAPVQTTTVVYPDEFPGSSPLSLGNYLVEWRRSTGRRSARSDVLEQLLVSRRNPPIATDAFTIPEAGATGGQQEPPKPADSATSGEGR